MVIAGDPATKAVLAIAPRMSPGKVPRGLFLGLLLCAIDKLLSPAHHRYRGAKRLLMLARGYLARKSWVTHLVRKTSSAGRFFSYL